ncbi:hypothetical protein TrRE_jg1634 [Triparma retinervis]|uniref:Uncharacterized protein n=1 Tax=Triparma retinervis TaxID=2557542 RepID=A0A9W7F8X2_9STRA|nr:hypothetical protein TrRE_jg1634 [Triparma retinervis]
MTIEERVARRGHLNATLAKSHLLSATVAGLVVSDQAGRVEKRELLRLAESLKGWMKGRGRSRAGIKETKNAMRAAVGGREGKGSRREVERRLKMLAGEVGGWIEVGDDFVKVKEKGWAAAREKLGGREAGGGKGRIGGGGGKTWRKEGNSVVVEERRGGGTTTTKTTNTNTNTNTSKGKRMSPSNIVGRGDSLASITNSDVSGQEAGGGKRPRISPGPSLPPPPHPLQPPPPRVNDGLTFEVGAGVSTRYYNGETAAGEGGEEETRRAKDIGDDKSKRGLKRLFNTMMKGKRLKD